MGVRYADWDTVIKWGYGKGVRDTVVRGAVCETEYGREVVGTVDYGRLGAGPLDGMRYGGR